MFQKSKIRFLPLLLIPFFFCNCSEERILERSYPQVVTYDVTDIQKSTAILHAEIMELSKDSILDHGFIFSDNSLQLTLNKNGFEISLGGTNKTCVFDAKAVVAYWRPQTIYQCRAYVVIENYVVYGNVVNFEYKEVNSSKKYNE